MATVVMPVKTFPVLFLTFIFFVAGGGAGSLVTETITWSNFSIMAAFNLTTGLLLYYILGRNKRNNPLFNLSLPLWIIVTVIGWGLGFGLAFT